MNSAESNAECGTRGAENRKGRSRAGVERGSVRFFIRCPVRFGGRFLLAYIKYIIVDIVSQVESAQRAPRDQSVRKAPCVYRFLPVLKLARKRRLKAAKAKKPRRTWLWNRHEGKLRSKPMESAVSATEALTLFAHNRETESQDHWKDSGIAFIKCRDQIGRYFWAPQIQVRTYMSLALNQKWRLKYSGTRAENWQDNRGWRCEDCFRRA